MRKKCGDQFYATSRSTCRTKSNIFVRIVKISREKMLSYNETSFDRAHMYTAIVKQEPQKLAHLMLNMHARYIT